MSDTGSGSPSGPASAPSVGQSAPASIASTPQTQRARSQPRRSSAPRLSRTALTFAVLVLGISISIISAPTLRHAVLSKLPVPFSSSYLVLPRHHRHLISTLAFPTSASSFPISANSFRTMSSSTTFTATATATAGPSTPAATAVPDDQTPVLEQVADGTDKGKGPEQTCDAACTSGKTAQKAPSKQTPKKVQPRKMTAEDREWNHLAEHMDRFHAHFRYEFNRVYTLADGGFHKEGMSLPRFIMEAQQLHHHLDMHHRIEEAYIFPILAKKMPQFKAGAREGGEHLESHRQIHDGLENYEKYLEDTLAKPSSYNPATLRAIMDAFREVLFRHLDEEVHDLGAESMKAAGWTLKEIRAIPM